jgi:chromosome segregation ATPase
MATDRYADLDARLKQLEDEERSISLQRRRLHDRLALFPDMSGPELDERERELSDRRRELHAEIDELRRQRSGG